MSEECDPLSFFLFFPFFSLSLGIRSLQAFLCDPWWIMVIPAALANSGSGEHFQVTRKRPRARAREGRREVSVAKLWEYMITVATRSSPYPDQMVDQQVEMTSTALNVNGGQDT